MRMFKDLMGSLCYSPATGRTETVYRSARAWLYNVKSSILLGRQVISIPTEDEPFAYVEGFKAYIHVHNAVPIWSAHFDNMNAYWTPSTFAMFRAVHDIAGHLRQYSHTNGREGDFTLLGELEALIPVARLCSVDTLECIIIETVSRNLGRSFPISTFGTRELAKKVYKGVRNGADSYHTL